MITILETFDLDAGGRRFRAEVVADECSRAPWDEMDTLGEVSDWRYGQNKAPGEIIIARDRGSQRVYDWAGAVRKARAEGMTGDWAVRAVRAEFDYFRRWCNDDWRFVGVAVFPLTDRGDELRSYEESLWGIESDADEYIRSTARDLALSIVAQLNEVSSCA
jgi:hypothetical protein